MYEVDGPDVRRFSIWKFIIGIKRGVVPSSRLARRKGDSTVILTRTRDGNGVRHDGQGEREEGRGGREAHYYHKIMKRDLAALRTAAHYG